MQPAHRPGGTAAAQPGEHLKHTAHPVQQAQNKKLRPTPCHSPLTTNTASTFSTRRTAPLRLPPSGM